MVRSLSHPIVVLIVEDEKDDLVPLERAFQQLHLDVQLDVYATGEGARDYLTQVENDGRPRPHLMILDLRLPGMSGLELLAWLRSQPGLKTLPVVALTGFGNRELPRAYDIGIDFYLLKPATARSLAEILPALGLYEQTDHQPSDA
jgi:CheY-like chemotaxis protein